jgi:hypothetical protein
MTDRARLPSRREVPKSALVPNETRRERALNVIPEGLAVTRHALDELRQVRDRLDLAFHRCEIEGNPVAGDTFLTRVTATSDIVDDARAIDDRVKTLQGIGAAARYVVGRMTFRGSSRVWRTDHFRVTNELSASLTDLAELKATKPADDQAVRKLYEALDHAVREPASRRRHVPQVLRRITSKRVKDALSSFDEYCDKLTTCGAPSQIAILEPALEQTESSLRQLGEKYDRQFSMMDLSDQGLAELERSLRQLITIAKASDRLRPGERLGLAELPPVSQLETADVLRLADDLVALTIPTDTQTMSDDTATSREQKGEQYLRSAPGIAPLWGPFSISTS